MSDLIRVGTKCVFRDDFTSDLSGWLVNDVAAPTAAGEIRTQNAAVPAVTHGGPFSAYCFEGGTSGHPVAPDDIRFLELDQLVTPGHAKVPNIGVASVVSHNAQGLSWLMAQGEFEDGGPGMDLDKPEASDPTERLAFQLFAFFLASFVTFAQKNPDDANQGDDIGWMAGSLAYETSSVVGNPSIFRFAQLAYNSTGDNWAVTQFRLYR